MIKQLMIFGIVLFMIQGANAGEVVTEDNNKVFIYGAVDDFVYMSSVNNNEKTDSFLGSGQYMLWTREAYDEIGGHEAIKGSIIEDYAFAKMAKKKLGSLYYLENHRLVSAQMYPDSIRMCWTGIKKVLFAGTRLTPPRHIIISTLFLIWGIVTPVTVFISWKMGNPFYLILTASIYIINLLLFAHYVGVSSSR